MSLKHPILSFGVVVALLVAIALALWLNGLRVVLERHSSAAAAGESGAEQEAALLQQWRKCILLKSEIADLNRDEAKSKFEDIIASEKLDRKAIVARLSGEQRSDENLRRVFGNWVEAEAEIAALTERLDEAQAALDRPGAAASLRLIEQVRSPGAFDSVGYDSGVIAQVHERLIAEATALAGQPAPATKPQPPDDAERRLTALEGDVKRANERNSALATDLLTANARAAALSASLAAANDRMTIMLADSASAQQRAQQAQAQCAAAVAKLGELSEMTDRYMKAVDELEKLHQAQAASSSDARAAPVKDPFADPPEREPTPARRPSADGDLSGRWRNSTGFEFGVADDGRTATIHWLSGVSSQAFAGDLTRDYSGSDHLSGTLTATFGAAKRFELEFTAVTIDADRLRVTCREWPQFNSSGRETGFRERTEDWTRASR